MAFSRALVLFTVSPLTVMTYHWKEFKLPVQMKIEVAAQANLAAKKGLINQEVTYHTQH
jgi:hypothetical protein